MTNLTQEKIKKYLQNENPAVVYLDAFERLLHSNNYDRCEVRMDSDGKLYFAELESETYDKNTDPVVMTVTKREVDNFSVELYEGLLTQEEYDEAQKKFGDTLHDHSQKDICDSIGVNYNERLLDAVYYESDSVEWNISL